LCLQAEASCGSERLCAYNEFACPDTVRAVQPRTGWQEQDGVQSGGGGIVRAAAFTVAGAERGGVTISVQVPDGFWSALGGGGANATLLLNPDEARGFAASLDAAADAADDVGPPLYG
jgi:hypothetical protein